MTENQTPDDNWEWETPERRRPGRGDEDRDSAELGFPMIWVIIGGLAGLLTIALIALGVINLLSRKPVPTPTPAPTATIAWPTAPAGEVTQEAGVEGAPTGVAPLAAESASPIPTETPQPTPPPVVPTPTPIGQPTSTPAVAEQPTQATPGGLAVGSRVRIVTEGGACLNVREGPSTTYNAVQCVSPDTLLTVIGGPKPDEQGVTDDETGKVYQWWQVRTADGQAQGWARGDLIAPGA